MGLPIVSFDFCIHFYCRLIRADVKGVQTQTFRKIFRKISVPTQNKVRGKMTLHKGELQGTIGNVRVVN